MRVTQGNHWVRGTTNRHTQTQTQRQRGRGMAMGHHQIHMHMHKHMHFNAQTHEHKQALATTAPRCVRGANQRHSLRGRGVMVRANQDEEVYDYSTEKIRSLLKRDSKELKGMEDLGESARSYVYSDEDKSPEPSSTDK